MKSMKQIIIPTGKLKLHINMRKYVNIFSKLTLKYFYDVKVAILNFNMPTIFG